MLGWWIVQHTVRPVLTLHDSGQLVRSMSQQAHITCPMHIYCIDELCGCMQTTDWPGHDIGDKQSYPLTTPVNVHYKAEIL